METGLNVQSNLTVFYEGATNLPASRAEVFELFFCFISCFTYRVTALFRLAPSLTFSPFIKTSNTAISGNKHPETVSANCKVAAASERLLLQYSSPEIPSLLNSFITDSPGFSKHLSGYYGDGNIWNAKLRISHCIRVCSVPP